MISFMVNSTAWSVVERKLTKCGVLEWSIVPDSFLLLSIFHRTTSVKMNRLWKQKGPRETKAIVRKSMVGGLMVPNLVTA